MEINYNQDEALLRRFYEKIYPSLPLYRTRSRSSLLKAGIMVLALVLAYLPTRFVLFLVGIAAVLFWWLRNTFGGMNGRRVDKILKYYREEFGKESVPCTVCCSDKEVTVGNDGLVRDYFLPYDEITGAVYDSEIFCFTTKDNAYYFPLSAIPDGKDALLDLLQRKNPSIQVSAL
ncbi:hypothetical protein AGATL06_11080 [Agathobaculum sp. TL06]